MSTPEEWQNIILDAWVKGETSETETVAALKQLPRVNMSNRQTESREPDVKNLRGKSLAEIEEEYR